MPVLKSEVVILSAIVRNRINQCVFMDHEVVVKMKITAIKTMRMLLMPS